MKKLIFSMLLVLVGFASAAAATVKASDYTLDPPYWWTGMACDTLQIMAYGPGIADAQLTMKPYDGVNVIETVALDSKDYLLVYLDINDNARPGQLEFKFKVGKKSFDKKFDLKARDRRPEDYAGFDASDVLYLIMPDRFAKGESKADINDLEYVVPNNRENPNTRHGGNIAGMRDHLDYIDSLGITAVWVNPVLENDMPGGSYHGYSTTDYYRIDPRFGTNEEWNEFVADAHSRGIKVVMDMIFNHSGSNHIWNKNRPSSDWLNFPDEYVQTNYNLTTLYDPYASDFDRTRTVDGWFVRSMPDLNQRNPHLMKYLIQNSIWWIESSKINGIRMDTYPYADERAMAGWIDAVLREYPNFNIVGECWVENEGGEAYWQRGSKVNPNGDPKLPTVMDFVIATKGRDAFKGNEKGANLNAMYNHLTLDYLYPDPSKILTFLDNHDTDRFLLEEPENLDWWKQALTFLLTTRGIPQLYYGTEILMNGTKKHSDGNIRRDMPGGFEGDTINAFTLEGLTDKQVEAHTFLSKILNWRKGNEVIAKGTLKHFIPQEGVYVYERRLGDKQVVVMMNGANEPRTISMANTAEILPVGSTRHDILSGNTITISDTLTLPSRAIYILEN